MSLELKNKLKIFLGVVLMISFSYGEDVAGLYSTDAKSPPEATKVVSSGLSTVGSGISSVGSTVGSTVGGVTSSISGVTSSINGSVNDIIGNLDVFDGGLGETFNQFNVGSIQSKITGDSQLLQCLVGSMDLGLAIPSGICAITGLGGINQCLYSASGASSLTSSLSSLCNPSSLLGGSSPAGMGNQAVTAYGSQMVRTTSSVPYASIADKSSKTPPKPLAETVYPSGKTVNEVYGDGGGAPATNAKEKPNSPAGKAYKELDVPTIELAILALQSRKDVSTDEALNKTVYTLPQTPMDVMEIENHFATDQSNSYVDLNALQKYIVDEVRKKYATLTADTLSDYYVKEKQSFAEFVLADERIAKARVYVKARIEDKYSIMEFNLKGEPSYLPDISETRAEQIHAEKRNKYRFQAVLQMNEVSLLKGQMAIEKEEWFEAIDRTVDRAYSASSIFRGDIAKKEIDEMLKAVDSAIK